jgi:hypothetical protein
MIIINPGDLAVYKCRFCGLKRLYHDKHRQVWCAECGAWNGWFDGQAWAQPKKLPKVNPDGQPGLF